MWDPAWVERFRAGHGGREPTPRDWQAHLLALRYPGSGPAGAWTAAEQETFRSLLDLLGPTLLRQIGRPGSFGTSVYSTLGRAMALGRLKPGPDGAFIALSNTFPRGVIPPNTGGWTWGNVIIIPKEREGGHLLLTHEYTHVLQYRHMGIRYAPHYLRGGLYDWENNPYEQQAVHVEALYSGNLWLPPVWELK